MTIRTMMRLAAPCVAASMLAACGGGHFTPAGVPAMTQPQQSEQFGAVQTMSVTRPAATSFEPSSWGKIGTFQIFDETRNGYISTASAALDGYRYSAVWGARPETARAWRERNAGLKSSYYFISLTDASTTAWGAIGHSLSWWERYHPTWILYACTSRGDPTHTPAYVAGLPNVPIDIHNTSADEYQVRSVIAPYASSHGYTAIAADEVTFWPAMKAGSGFPCGIWDGSKFIRRYRSETDPNYIADVLTWVRTAHSILRAYYPGLKLIVNHPGLGLNADEEELLENVDAVMDESGFTKYGAYHEPVSYILDKANWMRYGQEHGVTMLINQDWGALEVGAAQRDYSVATYLLGNEQSAAAFISPHTGYGVQVWRPEYATNIGAPCGEYYSGGSSVYFRRFENAITVVNASDTAEAYAHLPSGHSYVDLEGRSVRNPLLLERNDGYVLRTTDGCR